MEPYPAWITKLAAEIGQQESADQLARQVQIHRAKVLADNIGIFWEQISAEFSGGIEAFKTLRPGDGKRVVFAQLGPRSIKVARSGFPHVEVEIWEQEHGHIRYQISTASTYDQPPHAESGRVAIKVDELDNLFLSGQGESFSISSFTELLLRRVSKPQNQRSPGHYPGQ
jgi:hypothetical protein